MSVRRIDLSSTYLQTAVLGGHQLSLSLSEETLGHMKGHLHADPNTCQINVWGDRTICTKIAIRALDVETTRMRTLDPQGHGRILHQVHSAGSSDSTIHLIEYPHADLYYLTVVRDGHGTEVVPLFPAKWFRPAS